MKRKVLLIDDDTLSMQYYVKALNEKGFEVSQVGNPDDAIEYLTDRSNLSLDLIILDIMLPTGKRYHKNPDSMNGLLTGELLFEDIRKICRDIPVVILTNSRNLDIFSVLPKEIPFYNKTEVAPFELARVLRKVLGMEENARGDH